MRLNFGCVESCFGVLDVCKPGGKNRFEDCRIILQSSKIYVGPVSG